MYTSRKITLKQAQARYVNRYTLDHIPTWAKLRAPNGRAYAPQYASDQEWYENTVFPGEPGHVGSKKYCYSKNPSWPLGQWMD